MAQTSARLTLSRPRLPPPPLPPLPQMGFRMTMRAACDGRCWSWAQPRRVEAQESPDGMHARITYRGVLASTSGTGGCCMGQRRRGRFDKNRDRCVNGSELYQICRAVECAVTAMEVQEMLRMFDNDGDGTVRRQPTTAVWSHGVRRAGNGTCHGTRAAVHVSACGVGFCAGHGLDRGVSGAAHGKRTAYSGLRACVRAYPLVRSTTRSSLRASHAWR